MGVLRTKIQNQNGIEDFGNFDWDIVNVSTHYIIVIIYLFLGCLLNGKPPKERKKTKNGIRRGYIFFQFFFPLCLSITQLSSSVFFFFFSYSLMSLSLRLGVKGEKKNNCNKNYFVFLFFDFFNW